MEFTNLEFECIGMENGSKFPIEYTGRGQDISPEFIMKNLSSSAKTLAVTLEDLSHPKSRTTSPAGGLLLALRGRCYFSA